MSSPALSRATGPEKVVYPMLKHLLRSGMDFLLHIFNLPFMWKASPIIPIHKMGNPLNPPASFLPFSLTSCISKLFECIILSRILFLESNSILFPCQASFHPGWSTLNQILFLSQFILGGFNKPKPSFQMILGTIDFSKVLNSVWHFTLFHKFVSANLYPSFAYWPQSFLSCMVYQNYKSCSF